MQSSAQSYNLRRRPIDNPINQTILSTFMKKKKIKYDVAKNGEEAVQKWRSGTFHLILVGATPAKLIAWQFADKDLGFLDGYSDARDGRNTSD